MTVAEIKLPPEGSLYPTTTLLDWPSAATACSLHLLRQNHLLQMDTSNMSGLRYRGMRDATMRATRDYSPHKVAESVQGGEGQFLELWRLLLEALSWSIVLAVSVWISYKIHQLPDMSKNIVRTREEHPRTLAQSHRTNA